MNETQRLLLTNSSTATFKQCRKKYFWSYILGIRPEYDGKALRMGSAYHEALDVMRTTLDREAGIEAARKAYEFCPENFDPLQWEIERETVAALANGYAWRWGD